MMKKKKTLSVLTGVLLVCLAVFIYFRYFYVFAEGVKTGTLNYVTYKGYLFKTYEGKLIQAGFRSKTPGNLQSYDFEFSIVDKSIAQELMHSGGKEVELHYKEYLGVIPWRGYTKYIVDEIIKNNVPLSDSIPVVGTLPILQ